MDKKMKKIADNIIYDFKQKKKSIFKLDNLCGKHENSIAKKLFEVLGWKLNEKEYKGLYGWNSFKTDKCKEIDGKLLIIEVKKVTENSEYGYWHALIQGMLYSFLQCKEEKDYLILCIILDWGRKNGKALENDEKEFIDKFKNNKIYFIRISMIGDSKFIQHNLGDGWEIINEDDREFNK